MDNFRISVFNSNCQITPMLSGELSYALDEMLAFGVEGARFTQQYVNKLWDGKKHLFSSKKQTFPTGFLSAVVAKLTEQGLQPQIVDLRGMPNLQEASLSLSIQPWEHQINVLKTCTKTPRGLIQVATGGGKTLCIAGVWGMLNVPGVVLTQRKELMEQLRTNIQKYTGEPVGIFGDGRWEPGKLTVCMVQSLIKVLGVKYAKLVQEFSDKDKSSDTLVKEHQAELYQKLILDTQFLAADECHHIGAASSYALVQAMSNSFWRYGFSATAFGFRDDKKDYLVEAAIGNVIAKVTTTDLVNAGHLVPTDIIEIPYSHRGKHHPKDDYSTYYDSAVVNNEERNRLIVETAYGLYKKGKTCLVAVQRVDHGRLLVEYLAYLVGEDKVKFVYGDDKAEYRDATLKAFADQKLPILISTLISEGVDIPHLEYVISGRGEESRIATIQLLGRSMRTFPGKKKAVYFDIMDTGTTWLGRHSKTRAGVFRGESVFSLYSVPAGGMHSFLEGHIK